MQRYFKEKEVPPRRLPEYYGSGRAEGRQGWLALVEGGARDNGIDWLGTLAFVPVHPAARSQPTAGGGVQQACLSHDKHGAPLLTC